MTAATQPAYRVLVVDDSPFHRQMISRIIDRDARFQVIGEAANGGEAIKEVILKSPDLITLDLEMPGMDGFTFLRWLMFAKPTPTVVVSSRESNKSVFKALELGAVDFMVKPVSRDSYLLLAMEQELVSKMLGAASVDLAKIAQRMTMASRKVRPGAEEKREWKTSIQGIMVASSTGGPPALQTLLQAVPADFPIPVSIVQHMPAGFTTMFARRLAGLTRLPVKEAEDGDPQSPGVFIAPGGKHLVLERRGGKPVYRVIDATDSDRYVPSADRLFSSGADLLGRRGVGVILTGMGEDGIIGLGNLKKSGGLVVAEDESTCVVYGMPRAAVERGLADRVLPLQEIPGFLVSLARGKGS